MEDIQKSEEQDDQDSSEDAENPVTAARDFREYASIIPRHRPTNVEEIALLVEIQETKRQRSFPDSTEKRIFHVFVRSRVWIKRATGKHVAELTADFHKCPESNSSVFAEVLDSDQRWYVDRRRSQGEVTGEKNANDNGFLGRLTSS